MFEDIYSCVSVGVILNFWRWYNSCVSVGVILNFWRWYNSCVSNCQYAYLSASSLAKGYDSGPPSLRRVEKGGPEL
jgi:hypothetical protein